MENDIHPDLIKRYSLAKNLTLVIAVAPVLVSIGFIVLGFISIQRGLYHNETMAYLLSAACIAISILSEIFRRFLLGYNERTFIGPLELASRLMRQSPPKDMIMRVSGVQGLKGAFVDMDDGTNAKFPALFSFSKLQTPSKGEHPVQIYFDPAIGGKTIAMRYRKSMLIGRHLTYTEIMSEFKPLKKFVFATAGIIAAVFVFGSVWKYNEAAGIHSLAVETRSWPDTDASIVSSVVEEEEKSAFASRGPRRLFRTNVVYSYIVAGKAYSGNSLWPSYTPSREKNVADEIAARYTAGKAVRIHYKPSNPASSFIEAGHEEEAFDNTTRMRTGVIAMVVSGATLFPVLFLILRVLHGRINKFASSHKITK